MHRQSPKHKLSHSNSTSKGIKQMTSNLSVSSQTIEYMKTIDTEDTFTARQLADAMGLEDDGPVTGLLSRLKKMEIIAEVGRNGRASIYSITGDLNSYRKRQTTTPGGAEGRHTTG